MAKGEKQEGAATGKAATAIQLPSERVLKRLLKSGDEMKEAVDGLTGSHREEIKNAIDKHHLNKDAFALLKKFHRIKSAETKHILFHTFIEYLEMSGEMKLIDSVQNLPLGDDKVEEDEGNEGDAGQQGADNVRQFGGSRRRGQAAAEAAE
ncbi:MAG: hypothetical protein JSS57_07555 [Proteobacteria bacterium]|nr:hypothetical protein [Pseudomonadota bacterium]